MRLVLLTLAACAKSSTPAPQPVTSEPPPIGAAAGPDLEVEMARLRAIVEQACACEDTPCLEEADRAMAAYFDVMTFDDASSGNDLWPAALSAERVALGERVTACYAARGVTPIQTIDHYALRRIENHADRACACPDDACRIDARTAIADFDDQASSSLDAPGLGDRFRGALSKLARCLEPVLQELLVQVTVTTEELRDEACACADKVCAQRAARELMDWLKPGGTLGLVALTTQRARTAVAELGACVRAKP